MSNSSINPADLRPDWKELAQNEVFPLSRQSVVNPSQARFLTLSGRDAAAPQFIDVKLNASPNEAKARLFRLIDAIDGTSAPTRKVFQNTPPQGWPRGSPMPMHILEMPSSLPDTCIPVWCDPDDRNPNTLLAYTPVYSNPLHIPREDIDMKRWACNFGENDDRHEKVTTTHNSMKEIACCMMILMANVAFAKEERKHVKWRKLQLQIHSSDTIPHYCDLHVDIDKFTISAGDYIGKNAEVQLSFFTRNDESTKVVFTIEGSPSLHTVNPNNLRASNVFIGWSAQARIFLSLYKEFIQWTNRRHIQHGFGTHTFPNSQYGNAILKFDKNPLVPAMTTRMLFFTRFNHIQRLDQENYQAIDPRTLFNDAVISKNETNTSKASINKSKPLALGEPRDTHRTRLRRLLDFTVPSLRRLGPEFAHATCTP